MSSNHQYQVKLDTRVVSPEELFSQAHAKILGLGELLPMLASPDSGKRLDYDPKTQTLSDGDLIYPIRDGSLPLLLPERLKEYFTDRLAVPFDAGLDSFMQYFLLASIKQSGEINAASDDVHYQRHLFRLREFCRSCKGLVLDVGCDDPLIGSSLLPDGTQYVGLDPFCMRNEPFRLVGVGEFLPFQDASVDCIVFNTSLDHILDWRRALDEANRVLVPNGKLYICTLAWTDRAGLITDSVHFHHFREYEIFGALSNLNIGKVQRYDYKGDEHRYGLYIQADKKT